ncbi:MAG: hypothetical protein J6T74_09475 [Clostridia bacterium]|nr:hypothetical protein [Clostridia bacterium]
MSILAKIYVDNDKLYLENCGVYKDRELYPFGPTPTGGFRIGPVVIGGNNIAISQEAIKMFTDIVYNAEHTGDDVSCLSIFSTINGDIVVSWLGENKTVIDPKHLEDVFIGCGEGFPQLSLLNELRIVDNEVLKNHKFNSNDDIKTLNA